VSRRIAIVGSGISGLGAAWALQRDHDLTVFEADDRIGGHTNTVDVSMDGSTIPVDTGFIVYNEVTYPNLTRLFEHLDVPTEPSDMSYSLSVERDFEYGTSVRGVLAQPSNLLRRRFRRMLRDIGRFRRHGPTLRPGPTDTIGAVLESHGYSPGFIDDYLMPMAGAIWSARDREIRRFPARSILAFLQNHGLIEVVGRPQWRTVTGGSREYLRRLTASFADRIVTESPVIRIDRDASGVVVHTPGSAEWYDEVILATHTDQALEILGPGATVTERRLLEAVRYEENRAVLHSDPSLMPRRRGVWSSWNSLAWNGDRAGSVATVTYWMNRLQNIEGPDLFVSLNPPVDPAPALTHAEFRYAHPQFDLAAVAAQGDVTSIQGERHTWYCGAWLGYGFHEDGLQSGFDVAAALGSPVPWYDAVERASSVRAPSGGTR
jgi:predicted NAD/FAD-binding protein